MSSDPACIPSSITHQPKRTKVMFFAFSQKKKEKKKTQTNQVCGIEANWDGVAIGKSTRTANPSFLLSTLGTCVIVTLNSKKKKKKGQFKVVDVSLASPPPPNLFRLTTLSDFSRNSHVQTRTEYTFQNIIYTHEYLSPNISITCINTKNAHVYFHAFTAPSRLRTRASSYSGLSICETSRSSD